MGRPWASVTVTSIVTRWLRRTISSWAEGVGPCPPEGRPPRHKPTHATRHLTNLPTISYVPLVRAGHTANFRAARYSYPYHGLPNAAGIGARHTTVIRFEDIAEKVERYHPNADLDLLRRAYLLSAQMHKGQVRKSGEPYLMHPLAVAYILAEMRLDVICVTTGLLHDVVEDTHVTLAELERQFGPEIAHLVDGLTKISNIEYTSREDRQAETVRKMLLAMVDDIRVVLVKLADRLHNMRTLDHLPPEKRAAKAQETLDIYAPIAHRLGMGKIRGELEDLSFQYLYPDDYRHLKSILDQRRPALEADLAHVRARRSRKNSRSTTSRSWRFRAGSSVSTASTANSRSVPFRLTRSMT
jgi:hypothetical protein